MRRADLRDEVRDVPARSAAPTVESELEHRAEHRDVVVRGEVAERVVVRHELALRRPAPRAASACWRRPSPAASPRSARRSAGRPRVPAGSTWPSEPGQRASRPARSSSGRATSAGRPAAPRRRRGGSSGRSTRRTPGPLPPASLDQLAHPAVEPDARLDDQLGVVQRDGVGRPRLVLVRVDVRLEDAASPTTREPPTLRTRSCSWVVVATTSSAPACCAERGAGARRRRAGDEQRERHDAEDAGLTRAPGDRGGAAAVEPTRARARRARRRGRPTRRARRSRRRAGRRAGRRARGRRSPRPPRAAMAPTCICRSERATRRAVAAGHDQQARHDEAPDRRRARDDGRAEHAAAARRRSSRGDTRARPRPTGANEVASSPRPAIRTSAMQATSSASARCDVGIADAEQAPEEQAVDRARTSGRRPTSSTEPAASAVASRRPGDRARSRACSGARAASARPTNPAATPNAPSHGLKPSPNAEHEPGERRGADRVREEREPPQHDPAAEQARGDREQQHLRERPLHERVLEGVGEVADHRTRIVLKIDRPVKPACELRRPAQACAWRAARQARAAAVRARAAQDDVVRVDRVVDALRRARRSPARGARPRTP